MLANGEDAKAWKERWKRINEFTREETRRLTPEQRLRSLDALMDMAREMNWHTSTPEEIAEVRRRWKKIKEYGGQGQTKAAHEAAA